VLGRKGLKWALRIVGFFITAIVLLAWREASVKSGMESGVMGAFRGVIVFATYLAFFEWTKSLDPNSLNSDTDKTVPRIIGAELAKFVAVSTLVVAITYNIAPQNVNPEAVWWVSIIGIAIFAIWLWREKEQGDQEGKAVVTDPKPIERSQFEKAVWWVLAFLVFFIIVVPILFLILGAANT
jgi:small-conductance mechanosensitive channel